MDSKQSITKVEWLKDIDTIETLEEAWIEFQGSVNKRTIHSSFDWVFPWYKHLSSNKEKLLGKPLLGVAWYGEKICGLAPLVSRKTKIGKIPIRAIDHAGYDADAGELLIQDDIPELVEIFVDSIIETIKFDVLRLQSFDQKPDQLNALKTIAAKRNLTIQYEDYFYAFVDLKSGYQAYYTSKSSRYRRNLRIQEKKINIEGGWKLEHFTELGKPDEFQETISRIISIYNASWKAVDGKTLSDPFQNFYKEMSFRFASRGMLDLYIMSINSQDAAYFLALRDQGTLYDVFISYDKSFKSLRAGEFLMLQLLKEIPDRNIHTIVSHGAHEYKRVWASDFVPQTRIYLFPCGYRSFLSRILKFTIKPMIYRLKKAITD